MKKNRIITTVLGALIILAVVVYFLRTGPSSLMPFKKAGKISKIEIRNLSSGKTFRLSEKSGVWQIFLSSAPGRWQPSGPDGYSADASKIKRLTDGVKSLKFETVISGDASRRYYYSVSTANAVSVKVYGKKKIPEIYIGKPGADRAHFYAGFAGKPEIYLASGPGRTIFTGGEGYYRNRKICSVPESEISNLTITGYGKTFSVDRSSAGWKFKGKAPKDFEPTARLCGRITASGFSSAAFVERIKISIIKTDGSNVVWSIGNKEGAFYTAAAAGRKDVYDIQSASAEKIIEFLRKNGAE